MHTQRSEHADVDGFELFRRAIVERDAQTWAEGAARYRPMLISWATRCSASAMLAERVTTFDPSRFDTPVEGNPRAFSLVFADVPVLRDETLLLAYLTQLYPKISEQFKDTEADFIVEPAATPNWLSCASGETDGSGGPGGRPVPPRGTLEEGFQREQAALPDKLDIKKPHGQRGEGVHVFILDTASCEVDLRRALRKWVTGAPRNGNRPNPQLAALFGPNGALRDSLGRLQIDYAGHSHLLEGVNAFLPDHDYVMSDHGPFVASIVNALAPAAKLHLIEVLNPYGVGTLESIARGFARRRLHTEESGRNAGCQRQSVPRRRAKRPGGDR
jgi:hypothetical protein